MKNKVLTKALELMDKDGMEWEFVNDDSKVVVRLERMRVEDGRA